VQWVKNVQEKSETHPLDGSVVQRLQRFATYGSLKQQVLRIITDELAATQQAKGPLDKVCFFLFQCSARCGCLLGFCEAPVVHD
jgi:hypothetical protein